MGNTIASRVLGGIRPMLEGLIGRHGDGIDEDGHDIDEERDAWVNSIQMKLNADTLPQNADIGTSSIPRVPEGLHRDRNEANVPYCISIGPYHRGKPTLEDMEKCKWRCLRNILNRRRVHLDEFYRVLKPLVVEAKNFYKDKIPLANMEFMEMMLLDSSFIVDYFRQLLQCIPDIGTSMKHEISNDLLLLGNQLPFFVLNHIYPLVKEERETEVLLDLALNFSRLVCAKRTTLTVALLSHRDFKHLLDFYHAYLFHEERETRQRSNQPTELESERKRTIQNARCLKKVGIKFKKMNVIDKVIDVRFTDGVLYITPLVIDDTTFSQYRNLIAFEKLNDSIEQRFTAFARFMGYLISESEDVILLQKKGIIEHALRSDKAVADGFEGLTTGTFEVTLELATIYRGVDEYCNKKKNRWMAILKRDHLSSPCAIISVGVAGLILSFGVFQAVMTLLNYFKRKSFGH